MSNKDRGLRTRKDFSTTVKVELVEGIKKLSESTRIPLSRLMDEAIEDLLNKHKAPLQ